MASVYHGSWTFLIDMKPALAWNLRGVRRLRRGTVIELPLPGARAGGRDVRWVVPPGGMTDPTLLHQALSGETSTPQATGGKARTSAPGNGGHRQGAQAGSSRQRQPREGAGP
ncbi:hypothetical protein ABZ951_22090 [Streptomyces sp. NPDC046215]|uniref:DUF1905 domain-containing protein n=1 Tax=Streptomyces stramineus TaxID=173861 RepID=A0ABN1AMN4_9ACTN